MWTRARIWACLSHLTSIISGTLYTKFASMLILMSWSSMSTCFIFFECILVPLGAWHFHYSYLLNAHVHIVYFVALQIYLLENLISSLCILCEFGIDVACMFISQHQHCAQLIGIFECIVHRHRWISNWFAFFESI